MSAQVTVLAAPCIPTNDVFTGPLGQFMDTIAGALGGFIWVLAPVMMIVLALAAIAVIRSKNAAGWIKALVAIPLILVGLIVLLILLAGPIAGLNNLC